MSNQPNRIILLVKHKHLCLAEEIIQYLRKQTQLTIPEKRITTMPRKGWGEFYRHVGEILPEVYETMISDFAGREFALTTPTGENITTTVKKLARPTRYKDNPPWTIREKWGTCEQPHTIIHASDPDEVERDIAILTKYTELEI